MDAAHVLGVALVFVLAGGTKGVTGMGLPTVAASLLGLWLSPPQAAALLVAPSLVTNVAQCRGPNWRRLAAMLWPAWLALAVVTIWAPDLGAWPLSISARQALGCVLVLYGLWGLWRPEPPKLPPESAWVGAFAGAVTGIVTAATSVFVIPFVPYLQAIRLGKDAMVQALGMSFTVATLALAARLQAVDGLRLLSIQSGVALAASLFGMWLGAAVRARVSAKIFQRSLMLTFIALGAANLWRGG
jgi:uncharacterized membrane protein YfcA